MITVENITAILEQHIEGTDIFIVEVKVNSGNAIRVHVDRPEGISIDECVAISRFINGELDRDVEDYYLEVSSPGALAAFKVKQQYLKNIDRKFEVLFTDGEKTEGKLSEVEDDHIVLSLKDRREVIKFEEIKRAKAIISFN